MPAAISTAGVLPPLSHRQDIDARLNELVNALRAHPQMQPPNPHPTLYHIWDFVMRTKYILSELDNIEAGRPVQYSAQIAGYKKPDVEEMGNPRFAKELREDVMGRSVVIERMMGDEDRTVMAVMGGLPDMDFGEELKRKAKAVVDAFGAAGSS